MRAQMRHLVCDHARMAVMRESWIDERLDDFRGEVKDRFKWVDKRFEQVEGQIQGLRGELSVHALETKRGFDALHRLILRAAALVIGILATFCGALIGTVVT
jgi:hypothetical protein